MYRADKLYNDMMAVDTAIKQLKVEDEGRYDGEMPPALVDTSAAYMIRDNSKCIL